MKVAVLGAQELVLERGRGTMAVPVISLIKISDSRTECGGCIPLIPALGKQEPVWSTQQA